jgi:cysteine-rich repeat protein
MRRIALALIVCVAGATLAHAWEYRLERSADGTVLCGVATALASDPAGDVLATGRLYQCEDPYDGGLYRTIVVKLGGRSGEPVWRVELDAGFGTCTGGPNGIQVGADAAPVVITGSYRCYYEDEYEGLVTKLAPETGAPLWQRRLPDHWPATGGLDPAGNVLVGGGGAVTKLDGATGETIWSVPVAGSVFAARTDPSGDLVVALADHASYRVARYDGATGAERWSGPVSLGELGEPRIHPRGDGRVIVNGHRTLLELGADGTTRWSTTLPVGDILGLEGRAGGDVLVGGWLVGGGTLLLHLDGGVERVSRVLPEGVSRIAFDPGGDLVILGSGATPADGPWGTALLRKLDGASLEPLWSAGVDFGAVDGRPTSTGVRAMTIDLAGNVVAAGRALPILPDVPDFRDDEGVFAVMKRTGTTGGSHPCGDGVVDPGEACDDGNLVDGDGCDGTCRPSGCPSGRVSGDEECDDGNATDGDGCSAACRLEPTCDPMDVRGRWQAVFSCQVRDPGFGGFFYPTFTTTLDVAQQCGTGALRVTVPEACGTIELGAAAAVPATCESAPVVVGSVEGFDLHLPADGAMTTTLSPATPLIHGRCRIASVTLAQQFEVAMLEDRPQHAARMHGAAHTALELIGDHGTPCATAGEQACTVDLTRVGPLPGRCEDGCDDGDPHMVDGCDGFGTCLHEPLGGMPGRLFTLRRALSEMPLCSRERDRRRAARLAALLTPQWGERAGRRFIRRLQHRVRRWARRGAVTRPCARALVAMLAEFRSSLR